VNSQTVVTLAMQALQTLLTVSAPLLLAALATGLVVSIFQAATQINEMTLSFLPKLLAVFVVIALAGPWMIATMTDFMQNLFEQIPFLIG
jgi:flagellar biosynthetic protein FliQ